MMRQPEPRPRRSAGRFRGEKGFSLVETLAVIAILAIAALFALPHVLQWKSASSLRTAARELKENLEFARSLAVKENRSVVVELFPADQRYRISVRTDGGDLAPVRMETLPAGVRIDAAHPDYTVSQNRLSFNSRGGADNCTIVLSTQQDQSRRITVSTIGRIQLES